MNGDEKKVLEYTLWEHGGPAEGCTEVAYLNYMAIVARHLLFSKFPNNEIEKVNVLVDNGTYKNGMGVGVPHTGGMKGISIAIAAGAICGEPSMKLVGLQALNEFFLEEAKKLLEEERIKVKNVENWKSLQAEIRMFSKNGNSVFVRIEDNHLNITSVEVNGEPVAYAGTQKEVLSANGNDAKEILQKMTIADLAKIASQIQIGDKYYVRILEGVLRNLELVKFGKRTEVFRILKEMIADGFIGGISAEIAPSVGGATFARMLGDVEGETSPPAHAAGGSGNQGIATDLIPWLYGKATGKEEEIIIKSVALSRLMNSYIKCFTGDLSSMCGCSIAAGMGAAVALIYQEREEFDSFDSMAQAMGKAINNLVGELTGIVCHGGSEACALKVFNAVDTVFKAFYFALKDVEVESNFSGDTPEETIKNMAKVAKEGMSNVDKVIVSIMAKRKAS